MYNVVISNLYPTTIGIKNSKITIMIFQDEHKYLWRYLILDKRITNSTLVFFETLFYYNINYFIDGYSNEYVQTFEKHIK